MYTLIEKMPNLVNISDNDNDQTAGIQRDGIMQEIKEFRFQIKVHGIRPKIR